MQPATTHLIETAAFFLSCIGNMIFLQKFPSGNSGRWKSYVHDACDCWIFQEIRKFWWNHQNFRFRNRLQADNPWHVYSTTDAIRTESRPAKYRRDIIDTYGSRFKPVIKFVHISDLPRLKKKKNSITQRSCINNLYPIITRSKAHPR